MNLLREDLSSWKIGIVHPVKLNDGDMGMHFHFKVIFMQIQTFRNIIICNSYIYIYSQKSIKVLNKFLKVFRISLP